MWWRFDLNDQCLMPLPGGLPGLDGWLYGYSVFTTWRTPILPTDLAAHLHRVSENAETMGLASLPFRSMLAMLERHVLAHPVPSVWRLTAVAHPVGLPDFYQSIDALPTVWLLHQGSPLMVVPWPSAAPLPSLVLRVAPYQSPTPAQKVGCLAPSLQLRRQLCAGPHEAVLWEHPVTRHLTEATTANVVWIQKDGALRVTPPTDCLPGITVGQVIQAAMALGLTVEEQGTTWAKDVAQQTVDGGFLTNSVSGLRAIHSVERAGESAVCLGWSAATRAVWNTLYRQWYEDVLFNG